MPSKTELPFFTLLLLISFASVNAVLFTPALPNISHFFVISDSAAQQSITWFLIGYALGQLIYGPLANRFGRKPTLYLGVGLEIISSLFCVFAGHLHSYGVFVFGRFLLALGSGVGLKMTFTLVNECYPTKIASQKISYLMLAFAITPGLGVALGGVLNTHFGWQSCFYAGALYGLFLCLLLTRLPETQHTLDKQALQLQHLLHSYGEQLTNIPLIVGGFLMGSVTSFIYLFAAAAPFIAMNLLGMNSIQYGFANILPPIGLILGLITAAQCAKHIPLISIVRAGILIAAIGVLLMLIMVLSHQTAIISLFLPMIVIYFGLSLILANAATIAMSAVADKAHGSAVMNFINMGFATIMVMTLKLFSVSLLLLPIMYLILWFTMLVLYVCATLANKITP